MRTSVFHGELDLRLVQSTCLKSVVPEALRLEAVL